MGFVIFMLVALVATAFLVRAYPSSSSRSPQHEQTPRWARCLDSWAIAGAGLAFLIILMSLFARGPALPMLLLAGLAVGLLALWVREFGYLMNQPDEAFRGRNDKLIWALLLIMLPPVGVIAFWSYRRAHWAPEEKPPPIHGLRDFF